jgi:hypothetical protein
MGAETVDAPVAGRILWTIGRRIAMVLVLGLAFLLSATVTIYMLFRIGDTRVPAVVGKSQSDAEKMAEKAGLRVKIQRRSDLHIPEDVVIETRPAPNSSVKKESSLTIVVSSGPSQNRSQNTLPYKSVTGAWPNIPDVMVSWASRPRSG